MRQTELLLSKRDRQTLDEFRSQGMHMARELNRAHILAALDRKIPESQIMEVICVGGTVALQDIARPGKPKRYRTDEEAQVAALACSAPPAGAERWTVALLTEA